MRSPLVDLLGGSHRVLLIAPEADLIAACARTPYLVSQAVSADVIAVYASTPLDLVIVDGARWSAECWTSARDATALGAVPVLLVEPPEGASEAQLQAYGAVDSVTRPLSIAALDRRVRTAVENVRLRRFAEAAGAAIEAAPSAMMEGGLTGDPIRRRSRSPTFLDLALDELPAGLLTADAAQRITFINRAGMLILGLQDERYRWRPLKEVLRFPPELTMGVDQTARREYTFQRPNGTETELGVSITPVQGLHREISWFVLFRDLSSRRASELAARRVERLAAIGTMVAGFAHEVRNPVSAMRSLIEILDEETPASDPRRATLARVLRHIDRIDRLVKTSLRFGHPEEPRRAWVSPAKIAEEAVEQLLPRTRSIGELRVELGPNLPEVLVDEGQVVQVLVALLNNAVDAVGYPDQVVLRADAPMTPGGRELRFQVQDFGTGISEHIIGRIFDPFFTTKAGGTGLGLSIAQRLAHDNGGRLEVASAVGIGSTFSLSFPFLISPSP